MSSCSMSARLALAAAQASGWALAVCPWAKIGMSFEPSYSTSQTRSEITEAESGT